MMKNNICIEKATESDVKEISELSIRNLREINSKMHSKEIIDHSIESCSVDAYRRALGWKDVFVAKLDGKVVGTASLANFMNNGKNRWCVSMVFVSIEHHKNGFGSLLIKKLIELAKEKNANTLEVPSSRNSIKFYEKCGFVNSNLPEEEECNWMEIKLLANQRCS